MIIVGSVLGGALVLGVAVALLLQFVVFHHSDDQRVGATPSSQRATHTATSTSAPSSSKTPTPARKKSTHKPKPHQTPKYKKLYPKTKSGVFKVVATGCGHDGTKIGTAYLIDKKRAIASYASLARSGVIALTKGKQTLPATVDGADPEAGIVMLKLGQSVGGHHFKIAAEKPKKNDPVGTVGVPELKSSTALQTSKIVATGTSARVGHTTIKGLAEIGAKPDRGLSGAPVLNDSGDVAGMVQVPRSADELTVVPGSMIKKASTHGSMRGSDCSKPRGPDTTPITGDAPKKLKTALQDYFEGINSGDYRQAYEKMTSSGRGGLSYSNITKGWETTYDFNIKVQTASDRQAYVTFNSITDKAKSPDKHRTCTGWDMHYHFVSSGGELKINHVSKHGGQHELWSKC